MGLSLSEKPTTSTEVGSPERNESSLGPSSHSISRRQLLEMLALLSGFLLSSSSVSAQGGKEGNIEEIFKKLEELVWKHGLAGVNKANLDQDLGNVFKALAAQLERPSPSNIAGLPSIELGGMRLDPFYVEPAFKLWKVVNDSKGVLGKYFDPEIIKLALAIKITESGSTYPPNIGAENFGNAAPVVVSRKEQLEALEAIVEGIGGIEEVGKAFEKMEYPVPQNEEEIPCSSEMAIGPFQFLPTTWKSQVDALDVTLQPKERESLFEELKEAGIIERKVTSFSQLNPFDYREAFIVAVFHLQQLGIKPDGTNFFRWNNISFQQRLVTEYYNLVNQAFQGGGARVEMQQANPLISREIYQPFPEGNLPVVKWGEFVSPIPNPQIRETVPNSKNKVHGSRDYGESFIYYPETRSGVGDVVSWWGQDLTVPPEKLETIVVCPMEAKIVGVGQRENGCWVDLAFYLKGSNGEEVEVWVRIHHLSFESHEVLIERAMKDPYIHKGEELGKILSSAGHLHIGAVANFGDNRKEKIWKPIPATWLFGLKSSKLKTYSAENYRDGAVLSDEILEENKKKLLKLLGQSDTQESDTQEEESDSPRQLLVSLLSLLSK